MSKMKMTALIGVLFLIGSFHCARTAELQWSSRVQHGRSFSCPGEQVVFTCTVSSATHVWNITSESNPSDTFVVSITSLDLNPISPNMNYSFSVSVNASAQVIVTTATVIATPSIGTINVRCQVPFPNSDDDVQSVQAEFLDATWSFSVNNPSSERPLSDLSVNINIDDRARQCVDSFIITDNDASLNCTGDQNATTITCPPQNFCERNMYSLNGSTTTAFSVPSPRLMVYNAQIPSELLSNVLLSSVVFNSVGFIADVQWQIEDETILTQNGIVVNGSTMYGQLINQTLLTNTSKRFTFMSSTSQAMAVAQDTFPLSVSWNITVGKCIEASSSTINVANPISVINIFRSNNSIKVQIMQSINASQLSPIVSATCDSDPTPMNMTVGSTPMVLIIMLPSACMFTVELLSENGMVIGFPIRGDINNDSAFTTSTTLAPVTPPPASSPIAIIVPVVVVVICVVIILVIVISVIVYKKKERKSSKDNDTMVLREGHHPSDTSASNTATPEGDFYTEVSRDKKPARVGDRPEDHLPTYQAPDTIKREAAGGGAGGELYTVVDKPKKGGKKANDKNEDDVAQLYAMPDKSKKKQNQDQGLVYADIEAGGQAVRRPAPAPQRGNTLQQDTSSVTYSTVANVQSAM